MRLRQKQNGPNRDETSSSGFEVKYLVLFFVFGTVFWQGFLLIGLDPTRTSFNDNNAPVAQSSSSSSKSGPNSRQIANISSDTTSTDAVFSVSGSPSTSTNRLTLAQLTKNPPVGSIVCPPMMTPIYDKIVQQQDNINTNANASTTSIPKKKIPNIVHLSYNSRCVPTDVFADGIQKWKDELPDHSIYFHDDDAVDRLLEQDWPEFPNLHKVMNCIKYKGAMKVDLWRMLVVYEFGGFYSDVDNVPIKSFKNGAAIHPDDTFFSSSDGYIRPCQNAFAMEPKHPIAVFTIQTILNNLLNMRSMRRPKVVFVTGPGAFGDGYISYMRLAYPNKSEEELLLPGVYKGFMNKQIHKEPGGRPWNWLNPVGSEIIEHEGFNITRKERASQISGLHHWSKKVYWNRFGEDFSCREYLYRLEHPSTDNLITGNWTLNLS